MVVKDCARFSGQPALLSRGRQAFEQRHRGSVDDDAGVEFARQVLLYAVPAAVVTQVAWYVDGAVQVGLLVQVAQNLLQRQGATQAVGVGVIGLDNDDFPGIIDQAFYLFGFFVHSCLIIVGSLPANPKSDGLAAFQGAGQGYLIGVFQVDAD